MIRQSLQTTAAVLATSIGASLAEPAMADASNTVSVSSNATANVAVIVQRPSVSLQAARRVVAAARAEAEANGWFITVAVVDASGELVALERDDRAIGISPAVATGKARTAALLQLPSGEFERFINQGQPSFLATPGVTPLEGGMPLLYQGQFVGAVGVSGAHGPNDTQVATKAAAAINW